MKIALFPGSFDPFTRGHEAIVRQALTLFDKVVVAIGENIGKNSLFSTEERIKLIEQLYANDERVEAIAYSTLTGDVARKVGASAIIRGVRNTIDFEYERTLAQTNKRLFPEIETILLLTPADLADVSSSAVRELLAFGHDVSEMLPEGIDLQSCKKNI
jgi:pantetheine-phosphate adenylyltransferase